MKYETHIIPTDDISHFFGGRLLVHVLRLDLLDAEVSGNKWFKLRYHVTQTLASGKTMLTFGGPWSNHILATAAICNQEQIPCIGIIRGEQPKRLSETLQRAAALGMRLIYVSREAYATKQIPEIPDPLTLHVVPEGGYGETGARGAATILERASQSYDHYCCAVGTGTMLAGLINSAPAAASLVGVSVMKGNHDLEHEVRRLLLRQRYNWALDHDDHFGGYAKYDASLTGFMNRFFSETSIPTDFVYTGKLFFAINEMILSGKFARESSVLLIHSGGLAGNKGLPKGTLMY